MINKKYLKSGIPISVSLKPTLEAEDIKPHFSQNKKRLVTIAAMAVAIAIAISFIAKFLVYLIYSRLWNEQSQVYQLDFGGRVTLESAKNFQIEFKGKQVSFYLIK